jgi:hypothetical protein
MSEVTGETLFDQATLACTRCKAEYTTFPLTPLKTSDLKAWLDKNVVKFCDCDARHRDVKFRIKGAKP